MSWWAWVQRWLGWLPEPVKVAEPEPAGVKPCGQQRCGVHVGCYRLRCGS